MLISASPLGPLVSTSSSQDNDPGASKCFWVPPHPLFCLPGYSQPFTLLCCTRIHENSRVSTRIPAYPLMPPVEKGSWLPLKWNPWVSPSSPCLATVKGPFMVLPCTPHPTAPTPRGHRVPGGMSSSLQESAPSDTYKGLVFILQPVLCCICLHSIPHYCLPQFLSCPTEGFVLQASCVGIFVSAQSCSHTGCTSGYF